MTEGDIQWMKKLLTIEQVERTKFTFYEVNWQVKTWQRRNRKKRKKKHFKILKIQHLHLFHFQMQSKFTYNHLLCQSISHSPQPVKPITFAHCFWCGTFCLPYDSSAGIFDGICPFSTCTQHHQGHFQVITLHISSQLFLMTFRFSLVYLLKCISTFMGYLIPKQSL